MNNFCVMRFQKYQKNGCPKIDRHNNNREHLSGRKNADRQNENMTFRKYPGKTTLQIVNDKIKEIKERTGKSTAKNRVVVAEFVLTFSPEQTENIMKQKDEWIKSNLQWIEKEFGSKGAELFRWDLHMDETTPHIHAFVLTTDEKGMFNGTHFFAKKKMLECYQTTYAEAMKPYGLVRGVSKEQTKAKHIKSAEYLQKANKQIEQNIEMLKEDAVRIQNKAKELAQTEKVIDEKLTANKKEIDNLFADVPETTTKPQQLGDDLFSSLS